MKRVFVAVVTIVIALGTGAYEGRADHMAGRVYISPIAGTGTEESPYTAQVCSLQYTSRCRNAIGSQLTGGSRGHPLLNWALTYVETRNPATGLEDWTAYDALNDPFIVLMSNDLQATVPSNVKTRVRQSGALTQAELDTVTTYYTLLDQMLKKQNGTLATVENQFAELFPH